VLANRRCALLLSICPQIYGLIRHTRLWLRKWYTVDQCRILTWTRFWENFSRKSQIDEIKTFHTSGVISYLYTVIRRTNKKAVLSQRWPRDARYISRSWAVAEIWPFEINQDGGGCHLEFVWIANSAIRSAVPENPPYNQTWSGSDDRLQRYGHLKFFQDGSGRHFGFVRTVSSAVQSAVPENPTLEPNMKWIGSPIAEIWPFACVGGIWNPHFGGRGDRRGSAMAPLERAMVASYRLSIVTVALSVTIRPQFAIEFLRRSNQQGVGHFVPKFRGIPLGADPSCWGCKERTFQTN